MEIVWRIVFVLGALALVSWAVWSMFGWAVIKYFGGL